jgi:UPF0271 protein
VSERREAANGKESGDTGRKPSPDAESGQRTLEIDLNCDAGEAFGPWTMGDDEALIPMMTSVSVACGAHAGDPVVMRRTVGLARQHGVAVGAHPGYPDLQGFGRRPLGLSPAEVEAWMLAQIGALAGVARAAGARLQHVKPHGSLYNAAADDPALAEAVASAVSAFDRDLVLVARAGSLQVAAGRAAGLRVAEEGFVDRGYDARGRLLPRSATGALVTDAAAAAARAVGMVRMGGIRAEDGTWLGLHADTLCIHSDTPGASQVARASRQALLEAGVRLRPLGELAR